MEAIKILMHKYVFLKTYCYSHFLSEFYASQDSFLEMHA